MIRSINQLFYIIAYSIITVIAITSAIHFVIIKNDQTTVQREIYKSQNIIKEYGREYKTHEMKCAQHRNRYVVKDRLAQYKTHLILITPEHIETVNRVKTNERTIARR